MKSRIYKPHESGKLESELYTESELHLLYLVRGAEPRADDTKGDECPHCMTRSLFKLWALIPSWVWCSHCGALVSQLHGAHVVPDRGENVSH